MNEKSEKMIDDFTKTIEGWTIEARINELKLITKQLMKDQKPIDILDLMKWIGNRLDKLNTKTNLIKPD